MDNPPNGTHGGSSVRVGAVAVLVVLVVVAARERAGGVPQMPRVPGAVGAVVVDVLGVVCVGVLVAGLVLLAWAGWARRLPTVSVVRRRPPPPPAGRRRVLVAVLVGALAGLGVLLLTRPYAVPPPSDRPPREPGASPPTVTPTDAPAPGGVPAPASDAGQPGPVGYLIVFAMLASVLALAVLLLRRRRAIVDAPEAEPADAVAREAAGRGLAAVRDRAITDPRRAIVACFAAMEGALARLGGAVAPRAADTPDEVLRRGLTGDARIPEAPARALLELFREARFSAHPMHPADRDAAADALSAILTALDGPR
ncbi:DUF4129 domain-containing protein [Pseudonocardia acaciae]|uniref:DUF4129 domain-containing protein n=1 Tax=Pseudonocardia acaciae TaxID=551276 RepID=UPI0006860E8D|nr:DUF4129 domain-containing protein [Pseudonocardia acaciae]